MSTYGYSVLASSIVTSSIWIQDDATLRVWIAMLAMKDRDGRVYGSVPGFANLCRVTVEQMRHALQVLSSPDKDSVDKGHDGRRIEEMDGGWFILNHAKYRKKFSEETAKMRKAEWIANKRAEGRPPSDIDEKISRKPRTRKERLDSEDARKFQNIPEAREQMDRESREVA